MNRFFRPALLFIFVLLLVSCGKKDSDIFLKGDWTASVAYTGSMYPALKGGETLSVNRAVPFESLKIGDVIVWRWEAKGLNVLHRVIRTGRAGNGQFYVTTKGDANRDEDAFSVTAAEYRGWVQMPAPLAELSPLS